MVRSNFHTHTVFCDGKDRPEELAEAALALGFRALGFSGHSYTPFDPCGMTPAGAEQYRREVAEVRERFRDRLEIYCGVEQDCFSGLAAGYDYAIGSVHFVHKDGEYLPVDWSAQRTKEIVAEHYGGDPYAFAEDYYALVGQVHAATGCGIVGHFDLIRKYDEAGEMLDEASPRYRAAALGALDALCGKGLIFEINTGAMSSGTRTTPYPSLWLLREMCARSCPIMINSDCHDRRRLDYGFETARALARAAGYRERTVLRAGRFTAAAL